MSNPALAGLFVYAKDLEKLAAFYQAVLGLNRQHQQAELIVLSSAQIQLLVHAIPPFIADDITISTPPVRREDAAYKFFFTVPSLAAAEQQAAALGGELMAERWSGPGFTVANAVDPEGNIFQLREG